MESSNRITSCKVGTTLPRSCIGIIHIRAIGTFAGADFHVWTGVVGKVRVLSGLLLMAFVWFLLHSHLVLSEVVVDNVGSVLLLALRHCHVFGLFRQNGTGFKARVRHFLNTLRGERVECLVNILTGRVLRCRQVLIYLFGSWRFRPTVYRSKIFLVLLLGLRGLYTTVICRLILNWLVHSPNFLVISVPLDAHFALKICCLQHLVLQFATSVI